MTIRQCYETWGNKPEWKRLAAASLSSMQPCILRHHGSTDIEDVSDFSLQLWLASSEQPIDRKVKSRACMEHMLRWAEKEDLYHNDVLNPQTETQNIEDLVISTNQVIEEPVQTQAQKRVSSKTISEPQKRKELKKETDAPKIKLSLRKPQKTSQKILGLTKENSKKRIAPMPKKPKNCHTSTKSDSVEDYADINGLIISKKPCGAKSRGSIYFDCGSKGDIRGGMVRRKGCWRAEITINKIRYRHRSSSSEDCEQWLEALKKGKIKPTDNKADWFRMEQHKDDNIRIDEIVLSAAEETVMLLEYRQTGDIQPICQYFVQRLLPHMAYYCCHTLQLGQTRTITASRSAVALLLTRIVAGKPVINFTSTCKRMLRVYKKRGDFFYYENAPEQVKILVNGMNFDKLSEVWKVTRDKRI